MGRYNDFELDLKNVKVGGDVEFVIGTQDSINSCSSGPINYSLTNCCYSANCGTSSSRYALIGNDVNAATAC